MFLVYFVQRKKIGLIRQPFFSTRGRTGRGEVEGEVYSLFSGTNSKSSYFLVYRSLVVESAAPICRISVSVQAGHDNGKSQ